jgi:ATP-dependent DNA helicase RecQ
VRTSTPASWQAISTSSSRRPRSAWASTRPTCASCCTRRWPDSLDSYYQEIGRPGATASPPQAALFYRQEDLGLRRFFASAGSTSRGLKKVVALGQPRDGPVEPTELAEEMDLSQTRLAGLVNLLEQAGAVEVRDSGDIAASDDDLSPQQAAESAAEVAESHRKVEQSRIEMMRAYAETTGCRRQFLLGYFGETLEEPCGTATPARPAPRRSRPTRPTRRSRCSRR